MTDPSNRLAVLGVLLATFIATPASADDPKPAAAKPAAPAAAEGKAKGPDKAEKAEAKAEKAVDKAEAKADKAADKAEDKAEKAGEKAAERGEYRSALRELHADLRAGKIKPAEVKDRLAKLKEDSKDRRKAHREALKERWGDALARPNALAELKHHARRSAFLNRALILAETERKGKDKDKLVERIEKLIEKENERHTKAMERVKSGQAGTAPAAAAATVPGAATPPKANEPVKAGEK